MYWVVLAFFIFVLCGCQILLPLLGLWLCKRLGEVRTWFSLLMQAQACASRGFHTNTDTQSTLHWHLIKHQSIYSWVLTDSCVSNNTGWCVWKLVDFPPICNRDVNWVSTNMSIMYWSSFNWWLIEDWSGPGRLRCWLGVCDGYRLRVLIEGIDQHLNMNAFKTQDPDQINNLWINLKRHYCIICVITHLLFFTGLFDH